LKVNILGVLNLDLILEFELFKETIDKCCNMCLDYSVFPFLIWFSHSPFWGHRGRWSFFLPFIKMKRTLFLKGTTFVS